LFGNNAKRRSPRDDFVCFVAGAVMVTSSGHCVATVFYLLCEGLLITAILSAIVWGGTESVKIVVFKVVIIKFLYELTDKTFVCVTARPTNFIFRHREQDATFQERNKYSLCRFQIHISAEVWRNIIKCEQHIFLMRLMRYYSILEQQESRHFFLLVAFEYKSSLRQTIVFSSVMTVPSWLKVKFCGNFFFQS
jgi:hypothetical protein